MISFFFFSSRRRHTRCSRDWSSDVCSSDLGDRVIAFGRRSAPEFAGLSAVTYLRWTLPDAFADPPDVDAVVHCAGTVTDWGPHSVFGQVNVEGTRRVLRTFAGTRRFVHLSSATV